MKPFRPDSSSIDCYSTAEKINAVTLVTHGLNNKPTIMLPIVEWLRGQGSEVYLVKLFGHHEGTTPIKAMEKDSWYQEIRNAYYQAFERARELNVPIHFLGYSLGALVMQYAITVHKGKMTFDKQVLWAPATATRLTSVFLQAFFLLPKKWHLPSFTPKDYRANKGIPIKAYQYLYYMKKQVRQSKFKYLNIPTLIIADPKDELIDVKRLKKDQLQYDLKAYTILELNSSKIGRQTSYHHLIVDERAVGRNNWQKMLEAMTGFLYLS